MNIKEISTLSKSEAYRLALKKIEGWCNKYTRQNGIDERSRLKAEDKIVPFDYQRHYDMLASKGFNIAAEAYGKAVGLC